MSADVMSSELFFLHSARFQELERSCDDLFFFMRCVSWHRLSNSEHQIVPVRRSRCRLSSIPDILSLTYKAIFVFAGDLNCDIMLFSNVRVRRDMAVTMVTPSPFRVWKVILWTQIKVKVGLSFPPTPYLLQQYSTLSTHFPFAFIDTCF